MSVRRCGTGRPNKGHIVYSSVKWLFNAQFPRLSCSLKTKYRSRLNLESLLDICGHCMIIWQEFLLFFWGCKMVLNLAPIHVPSFELLSPFTCVSWTLQSLSFCSSLNFNGEKPSHLIPPSPMPKAKPVPFTPSDSQLLWKKDPRLKGLTFSKARTAVNQYIHNLVIDLAEKPPNHASPHHHNHPVSRPQIAVGQNNYKKIGSYYVLVSKN
jgi:hypothetical protein